MNADEMNDPELIKTAFESMDRTNTGKIRASDLQQGLSNGTDKPFDIKTCQLMIAMFDRDNSLTIDFNEFTQLWQFVNSWVKAFQSADVDQTGEITQTELNRLLNDLGYRLSQKFYTFIGLKFKLVGDRGIVFDEFLWICIMLHILTGAFSSMDYKRDGEISLSYDQFLCTYLDVSSI